VTVRLVSGWGIGTASCRDVASEDAGQEVADVQEGERADRSFEFDERIDVAGRRQLVAASGAEQLE
jgi:hypothetical protein